MPSCGGADGFDIELDALYSLQSSQSALSAVYNPTAAEQLKNRYCDVLPNSASRIRLRTFEGSDYVNASLVSPDLFSFPAYPYIAAQAPLSTCVADFWHMVLEQRSELVVMLTKEKERGKDDAAIRKADRYWPPALQHNLTLGPLTVTLTHSLTVDAEHVQQLTRATQPHTSSAALAHILHSCQPSESAADAASASSASACPIVIREFALSCGGEVRTVRQLHYLGWPDHGVPSDLASFASLLQLYRSLRAVTPRTAPVIVHCSAGIGRTGTFCTIDLALDQLAHCIQQQQHSSDTDSGDSLTPASATAQPSQVKQAAVSVANIVRLLRVSRPGMVQTKGQYQFCYRFIDWCVADMPHCALIQPHFTPLSPPPPQMQPVDVKAQSSQNGHSNSSSAH